MDQLNSRLSCIFHSMFGIVFGIIIILVMGVYVVRYPLCIPAALIMSAAYLFVLARVLREREAVKSRKSEIIMLLLFGCMIVLQLYLGYLLRITPSSDRNVIFHQAQEIADSGIWKTSQEWNYYFLRYPNNRILLLVQAAYFSFVKVLGIKDYLMASIVLNVIMIDTAVLLMLQLAKKVWNRKAACGLMICCFLFVPFYLFGPFVYTDTLTLPIVAGAANLYYRFVYGKQKTEQNILRQIFCLSALAAILWFGYSLKASIAILLVAIIIHMICVKRYRGFCFSLILLSVFVLLQAGSSAAINRAQIFDETDYDTENFPYTHWIMMGLKGVGNYDKTEREFTSSFSTRAEKEEANIRIIKERLTAYGTGGLVLHQLGKAGYTWSNGMYDMEFYLNKKPLEKNIFQKVIFEDGKYLPVFKIYTEGYHLAMLGLVLLSIVVGIRKKPMDIIAVLKLAVFGLLLFLLIWETRPRYLMHFVPLLFLIAIDGQLHAVTIVEDRIKKKRIK